MQLRRACKITKAHRKENAMKAIEFRPIGMIRTPFPTPEGAPIQPQGAAGVRGTVEVFADYRAGLDDLSGFSHIYLLYHFHLSTAFRLKVKPFLDTRERGLFATRAPSRPNAIGISVVRLLEIDGNLLHVEDIDVVDKTPLLDIKPYIPDFDVRPAERIGWLQGAAHKAAGLKADGRFCGR
jgi:tRNA-Thr(GGU) m(6)t(6)A37 methyltransferase TsaA